MLTHLCTDCVRNHPDRMLENALYEAAERRYGTSRPTQCVACGNPIELYPKPYRCWDCGNEWDVGFTEMELRHSIDEGRTEACSNCSQRVGRGTVDCRGCGHRSNVDLPHWHVDCDVYTLTCESCGRKAQSLCVC